MNIQQTGGLRQSNHQTLTGQVPPDPKQAGQFEGQLTAAQGKLNELALTETFMAEERKHIDQLEKEQKEKSFARQQANTDLALAMVTHQKIHAGKNQANFAQETALDMNQFKEQGQSSSTARISKNMEQIQGKVAEKVNQQKGERYSLANPDPNAEMEAKEPSFRSMTEGLKDGSGKKDAFADLSQFKQNDEASQQSGKKSVLNMANFAHLRGGEQAKQAPMAPANQKLDLARESQSLSAKVGKPDAVNAAKSFKSMVKMEGPAASGNLANQANGDKLSAESTKSAAAMKKPTNMPNMKEVAQNVKVLLSTDRNEMTMRLNPAHLGRMEIKIKKSGDQILAQLKVESGEALEAIQRQLPELKDVLQAQGIQVDEFALLVQEDAGFGFAMNSQGEGQSGAGSESQTGKSFQPTLTEDVAAKEQVNVADQEGLHIYA